MSPPSVFELSTGAQGHSKKRSLKQVPALVRFTWFQHDQKRWWVAGPVPTLVEQGHRPQDYETTLALGVQASSWDPGSCWSRRSSLKLPVGPPSKERP